MSKISEMEYACFKRYLDYYIVDSEFRELFKSDTEAARRYVDFGIGFNIFDDKSPNDKICSKESCSGKSANEINHFDALKSVVERMDMKQVLDAIESIFFAKTINDNIYKAEYERLNANVSMFVKRSVSEDRYLDKGFAYYGQIVRNRCQMERMVLRQHSNIYYYPLAFELGDGCRVQCDFCGLAAPCFKSNFEYNSENSRLWKQILMYVKERIGDVADDAPCYFATEPMDNPDYEKFLNDYFGVFGVVPQTTTALADAYPDRIAKLIKNIGQAGLKNRNSLRISIRTLAQFKKIMGQHSYDELKYVEIIANNKESVNRVSNSGRAAENSNIEDIKRLDYSISCVAGLLINMPRKEISFIEPQVPNANYPMGIKNYSRVNFSDIDDFKKKVDELIKKYAVFKVTEDTPLILNENIRIEEKDGFVFFVGDGTMYKRTNGKIIKNLIGCLKDGPVTPCRMANRMGLFGTTYIEFMKCLNELFIRGYIEILYPNEC